MMLETLEVTAQKKKENVQDVPISMTVTSGEIVEDAGIKNLKELMSFSPNVFAKQIANLNTINIRGITANSMALDTTVGVFVDGISYPMVYMQNPDLMDVERIEVLRGPQGTLYGRNTETGAINIITKQPGNELSGKIFIEPAFYETRGESVFTVRAGAGISGPIVKDKLFFGGSLQYEKSDGYMKNIYDFDDEAGAIDHKNYSGKIRWIPSSKWEVILSANGYETDDGYGYIRFIDGPNATDRNEIDWDGGNYWKDENNGQSLHVKYSGTQYNVESITTRNDFTTNFVNDSDFTSSAGYGDQEWVFDDVMYSQEFRISSPENSEPFSWIAGVYGFKQDVSADLLLYGLYDYNVDYSRTGYAAFAEGTYTLGGKLHITAGIRYDYQESDGDMKTTFYPDGFSADTKHGEWLPKVSVAYDITDSAMVYTSASRGIMAGGYDYVFATDSESFTFDPEYSLNYEIGTKTGWFSNRLIFNATAFYIDIKDKQIEEFVDGSLIRTTTNASAASSKGFELELLARPYTGWQIFAGLGYADAQFEDWKSRQSSTGDIADYSGKQLPYAPKYTFNTGVQYNHSSGLFGRLDMTGISSFYSDEENEVEVDGHEVFNLKVGYETESYQVSLWCKNIFDEGYYVTKAYMGTDAYVQDGTPKTVGVTLAYKF